MTSVDTTSREVLAGSAYADDRHLSARQSLYAWQTPRHDLPGLVLDHIEPGTRVVVDVGCGNGMYVRRIRDERPDLTVVGLDVFPGMAAAVEPPRIVADAMRLPFVDSSVGAVLAMHMLYHVQDVDVGLAEFVRVLAPDGTLIASTNALRDKAELDDLWATAAGDVLGMPKGPGRISLSDRFPLDDAPFALSRFFGHVKVHELPGTITVTRPEPVIAYLASFRTWADGAGVPFDATLNRAKSLVASTIEREGAFRITCRGGILICRHP